ncbi:hypothetical protein ACRALDRAFT_1059741 [Sodiomyces alcalophilus JCM 7366]|uniref:uncharacterized protein n=1 Tax=Sodiomyces alcalophilus JCM 7366 TaxID=591952 RepID=UPI0039B5733C
MTTSSRRGGYCRYCGHAMNEHTSERGSKCKKCGKLFLICQANVHDLSGEDYVGWTICYQPCWCGKEHRPSKVRDTPDLPSWAYASTHPLYKPPSDTTHEVTEASIDESSIAGSTAPLPTSEGEDQWVEIVEQRNYTKVGHVLFRRGPGCELESTPVKDWTAAIYLDGEEYQPCYKYVDATTQQTLWAKTLTPGLVEPVNKQDKKGKRHIRSWSQDSEDPLTRVGEEGESIDLRLAALTLDGQDEPGLPGGSSASASQSEPTPVSVWLGKKGRIYFIDPISGVDIKTNRTSWKKVKGGFLFQSQQLEHDYFTSALPKSK